MKYSLLENPQCYTPRMAAVADLFISPYRLLIFFFFVPGVLVSPVADAVVFQGYNSSIRYAIPYLWTSNSDNNGDATCQQYGGQLAGLARLDTPEVANFVKSSLNILHVQVSERLNLK